MEYHPIRTQNKQDKTRKDIQTQRPFYLQEFLIMQMPVTTMESNYNERLVQLHKSLGSELIRSGKDLRKSVGYTVIGSMILNKVIAFFFLQI